MIQRKKSKYIRDFDATNVCGWAMTQYLSYGQFKWL